MRLMALEKVERTYANRGRASMTREADEALSDTFQIGYELVTVGLIHTSYFFRQECTDQYGSQGGNERSSR